MARKWMTGIPIAFAIVALACGQPATDTSETPAVPEDSMDPAVTDADHYTVEFENDSVRVLRIRYGVGEASTMHEHPDSVAVFLTPHHVEFSSPDGTTEEVRAEAGQAIYTPAGQHLPKNIGGEPMELVLVELKTPAAPPAETGPDSTVADPDHYSTELENDRVRIVRIKYGPGEESVMHYHPESVAVFLTPHDVAFQAPDGTTQEIHSEAGTHAYAPAEQHLPKNIGEEPLELVLVEIKA